MASIGTRETLTSILDDVEYICKEFIENLVAPKNQKLPLNEVIELSELAVQKQQELKDTLKIAVSQAEIQKKIDALQAEVEKQDQDIHQLQKYLKEADHLLATAVYQARQKLHYIAKANEKSVSSEELIKYAHRISASHAVAAPHNWHQGDTRRPYPTDIEMRLGFLGRFSDLPISGNVVQQQGNLGELSASRGPHDQNPSSQPGTFSWQSTSELKSTSIGAASNHNVPMETKSHSKESEDVEVMSSDSSSSSSSDSQ